MGKKRLGGGQKKSKKSWFFSWWKIDRRKSKTSLNPVDGGRPSISKPTKGYASSGPILCGSTVNAGGVDTQLPSRLRRLSSGPVSILFNPTRKVENEVPYMSLDHPNDPYQINAYGPVYLVT